MPFEITNPVGTFVSIYTGAGGMDIGFARAGFRPVWANDIDPVAVATYNNLFADHVAREGDIRQQDLPGLHSADLVIGGPPCQGFSVAGRMDPNDPRSRHVWDFLGVVDRVKPRVFVMENVKALAINRRWSRLRNDLIEAAEEMGYRTQLLLLNASHFGVPQARERMFLIGRTEGNDVVPVPVSAGAPPTVRQVLSRLPQFGLPGNDSACNAVITPAKNPVLRKSPYAGMLFNGQGRPLNLDRPATTLPASMGGNRTPIIDQREVDGEAENWILGYHKHLWGGGSPYETVPSHLRRTTVEEAAALQTFPDEMIWEGRKNAVFRQIGNAVPPMLAFHVADAVRYTLGYGRTEPAESTIVLKDYLGEARTQVLADVRAAVPNSRQLSMLVEEKVLAYPRDGNHQYLADTVAHVEAGRGTVRIK